MMNVTGNYQHARKKPGIVLLANRMSGELPPDASDESLLQVLTRYGADSAFLIGGNKRAVPKILAGAERGKLLAADHPLVRSFREFIGGRTFEFRHYLIRSRLPISRALLMQHFPSELQAMLSLPAAIAGKPWRDINIFPLRAIPFPAAVVCFFPSETDWRVDALFAGAIRARKEPGRCHALSGNPFHAMTEMQHRCARWAAKGKTAEDIAEIEGTSVTIVRVNLYKFKNLLGCSTLTEAIIVYSQYFNITPL
jgi:DNA-binding CsgD family transcriptional regulator